MKTFLTDEELVELTGSKRKSNQIRWLTQHRYPHETNAQGAWEVDTRSGDNIWAPDCNIMVQCLGDKSNVSAMTSFLGAATPSTVLALQERGQEVAIEYA